MKNESIKLKYPIKYIDKEGKEALLESVILTRLKNKHIRALPESFFEKEGEGLSFVEILPLVATIVGVSEEEADEIDLEDTNNIIEGLTPFLEQYRQTGKK